MNDSKGEISAESNDLKQIINFQGEFMQVHLKLTPSALQEFSKCLKDKNVYFKGFNYFVVAIMGCQSGGKSIAISSINKVGTLLNFLFGTRFPVMDASEVDS